MANTVMTRPLFRAVVEPILNQAAVVAYNRDQAQWMPVFSKIDNVVERDYHEDVYIPGFRSAPLKPEGTPVTYTESGTFYTPRYRFQTWGLAFALSQELIEDSKHISLGKELSQNLGISLKETDEINGANILNNGFNPAALMEGGEGTPLFSTTHPLAYPVGGTWSNRLAIDAALSQTSLEQMVTQIRQTVDATSRFVSLTPDMLVVPPALEHQARTILWSTLRTGTNNNDMNPIGRESGTGYFPGGVHVMQRLTSPLAWFVTVKKSDVNDKGLRVGIRRDMKGTMEGDFETDSVRFKVTNRYRFGWTDPRHCFATAGS